MFRRGRSDTSGYSFNYEFIRELTIEPLQYLSTAAGQPYDPVASNLYPLIVLETRNTKLFDYSHPGSTKWCLLQQLDQPNQGHRLELRSLAQEVHRASSAYTAPKPFMNCSSSVRFELCSRRATSRGPQRLQPSDGLDPNWLVSEFRLCLEGWPNALRSQRKERARAQFAGGFRGWSPPMAGRSPGAASGVRRDRACPHEPGRRSRTTHRSVSRCA